MTRMVSLTQIDRDSNGEIGSVRSARLRFGHLLMAVGFVLGMSSIPPLEMRYKILSPAGHYFRVSDKNTPNDLDRLAETLSSLI